ncbi:Ben and cat operon transcriptional regulator [Serratia entomophila]|jgi:DNA-binding transcriptional LysR family regulator|uniref:LysR family transcriptional regulator n=1 Tax=Serratia entomophila TaxID=42906 RepID=A0ABY5CZW6_9GAMM|nr:LysR family transcriptional regulator [Serratia entomophila]UIW20521.1 LysR family transcriptional regulator [Serratia entomophila]USV03023.1 LysR family transcriptional regulator [Serratia entomophila]CAI0690237.1 Ben and cat operon transcriptional regulator [Serratia entomophila]CAI0698370.1 Ben and cat operon transcriptional regulator [Serratia entomophila]CAI0727419.1 Ben and cat operon transcriptional regulator [Serratia entomophila]
MNIELRHLRYFIAVAEELHFGRAAERLRISQPPLSQQIQALEEMVGARLLARNNRNVSLTQAGEMFLKEAYQVVDQVARAAEKAARLERGELGELTIGFTSSAPFISVVSRSLRAFRQQHLQVHIKMREINTKQQIEPLLNGELDLGVMRNTRLPDALRHHLLLCEPLVAVVPEGHPLSRLAPGALRFQHLAEEPFVFFSREVGTALYDEILLLLSRAGITPYITQEVGEAMTIIGLVAAGLGVSILPASFSRVRIDGVKYLPLAEPDAVTEVWLVHHRQRPLTAAAKSLMALMLP